MISSPQGDVKHTGHVGLDGAYFGDISFLDPAGCVSTAFHSVLGELPLKISTRETWHRGRRRDHNFIYKRSSQISMGLRVCFSTIIS